MTNDEKGTVEILPALTIEEQNLQFTQGVRKKLVDKMTKDGTDIPEDKGDKMVLLAALSDMDKVSLGKLRIKADDKTANAAAQAGLIVARLLSTISPKQMESIDNNRQAPMLGNEISDGVFVDGEQIVGTQHGDYNTFSQKFESPSL